MKASATADFITERRGSPIRYDVLLSDADGTLFDFLAGEKVALKTVLCTFHLPADEDTLQLYSAINEKHWKKMERGETTQKRLRVERFSDFLNALGISGDAAAMSDCYMDQLGQQRILLPEALNLCKAVSARIPIVLVTNGIGRVQRSRLAGSAIEPYLRGVVISEELGHAKPEPHILLEALRICGIHDKHRAILLGDSLTADIGAAQAAEIDSIWFTNGPAPANKHGATYVAETLVQAQALILQ